MQLHFEFTNNTSNFAQLFINSSNVSVIRYIRLMLYLNKVFTICPPVAATYDWNLLQNDAIALSVNAWSKSIEIILYRRQNGLPYRHDVGQLWHVSSIVFQYCIPHMIIHWHIHIGAFATICTSKSPFSYLFIQKKCVRGKKNPNAADPILDLIR